MDILNAKLAPTLKRVAKNVADIVKQKNKISESIKKLEADLEVKKAKLQAEYDSLVKQQELFEAPVRELTGGYGTEDLIATETVETGVDKNGKPTHSTKFVLKYPDTILPPAEEVEMAKEPVNPPVAQVANPGQRPFGADNDLPFGE